MRHAPLAPKRSILNRLTVFTPLVLGPVLLVSGCERSDNSPASPRTSEIVRLSQAPVDAVPYVTSRPSAPPAQAPKTEPAPEAVQTEASATPTLETPAPPPVTATPASPKTPVAAPTRQDTAQPQPDINLPQN